jgi:hypothetical protein
MTNNCGYILFIKIISFHSRRLTGVPAGFQTSGTMKGERGWSRIAQRVLLDCQMKVENVDLE